MRDYIVMTDSCCDLTDQMARELELEVLPLTMHMDGENYPNDLAGTAISNQEFYGRLRAGKIATTSAANVGQFQEAMRRVGAVVEGYYAAGAAWKLAKKHHVTMPITEAAYEVLYEGGDPQTVLQRLMQRQKTSEMDFAEWAR